MEGPGGGAEIRREPAGICRFLRAKTGYGTTEGGAEPWLLVDTSTTTFRCLRTLETYGPDGDLASAELCRHGRGCFAPPARAG